MFQKFQISTWFRVKFCFTFLTSLLDSSCNVNSPVHVTVEWRRSGSLPSNSIVSDEGRTLRLLNFSPSQAGTYECIVRSRHQTKIDSTVVTLQSKVLNSKD